MSVILTRAYNYTPQILNFAIFGVIGAPYRSKIGKIGNKPTGGPNFEIFSKACNFYGNKLPCFLIMLGQNMTVRVNNSRIT